MLGFNGGLIGKTQTTSASQSLPGMWTLTEHLEAKRNNSWPTVVAPNDPYFNNVSLLLRMNGSNGSTTFTDDSLESRTITRANATISTVQSKYGGSSGSFIPTSYLQTAAAPGLQFPGDFTIELWHYTASSADMVLGSSSDGTNTQIFRLNQSGNTGAIGFYMNNTQVILSQANLALNTWQHLAFCRSGTNTRMFVDGIQKGTTNTTWSGTFRMDVIGVWWFQGSPSSYYFNGYMDDLRITKNFGRYTSNFTPPGPL